MGWREGMSDMMEREGGLLEEICGDGSVARFSEGFDEKTERARGEGRGCEPYCE